MERHSIKRNGATFLGMALTASVIAQAPLPDPMTTFTARCASCHGPRMEGARAASLLDDAWTFGGTDEKLLETIREGRMEAGMPAFKELLTASEIRGLLVAIRTRAVAAKGAPAVSATPMPDGVIRSQRQSFRIEVLTDAVETPWGLAFLPDGRLLVTERPGRLRIIQDGKLLPDPVRGTPAVLSRQDAGLLDVEVHPKYAENGWIYLAYAEPRDPNLSMTTIVRGRIVNNQWMDQQVLYRAPDDLFTTRTSHYGLRFIFDRAGFLYYSIGDRGIAENAQNLALPTGKIHRIQDDGKIPADNPFVNRADALGSVWSYGHRNPEGFSFSPSGVLWQTEHGPSGGDEVNIIEKGHNYGWPVISYGLMDNGRPTATTAQPGMDQPVVHWEPSPGLAPILFYTGDRYPGWKGDVLVGAMGHEELKRLSVDGTRVTAQEVVFKGLGRVRDMILGPDGLLYLALAKPGAQLSSTTQGSVVRLVPVP